MTNTGVLVSESDRDRLKKIFLCTKEPLFGTTMRSTMRVAERIDAAIGEFYTGVDTLAQELGLPPPKKDQDGDVIHYGLNFNTREILAV